MPILREIYYPDDYIEYKWELTLTNGAVGRHILIDGVFTNYIITEKGNVFNIKTEKMLKEFINTSGYPSVNIQLGKRGSYKTRRIHRLVALAYLPNKENKPTINHIDGNKRNYSLDNLEWATYSENNYHAFRTGLRKPTVMKSEDCRFARHTKDEAIEVCEKLQKGYSPHALHELFGIDYDFALKIYNRITWLEVSRMYNFDKVILYNKFFTLKEIKKIVKLYHKNITTVKGIIENMNWEYDELLRGRVRMLIMQINRYDAFIKNREAH